MSAEAFADAFNMLCRDKIGSGIHRDVFECRIMPEFVVKVETDGPWRYFANALELKFWNEQSERPEIAKWLAPVIWAGPDCRVILQRRCDPVRSTDELPEMLPAFLSDIKRENFGFLEGRLVCFDYAMHIENPSARLRKVKWS